jgi:hypothetical protein
LRFRARDEFVKVKSQRFRARSLMSPLVAIARDYNGSRIVIVECAHTHLGLQSFLMMTIVSDFAARVAQRSQLQ